MMRILVIDDEEYVRLVLEQALQGEGCLVTTSKTGQAGIEALKATPFDCVITDLRMPGIDGRDVLRWVKEHQPDVEVIMLTGHGDVKDAVEAIKKGAWDFLVKDTPFDGTAVTAALSKLRTVRSLRRENLAARRGGFTRDVIVEGVSKAWRDLKAQIVKIAPAKSPVLIQGETGSGKEIVARLLHELSGRAVGPFLAINCGAMNRELLESELFGHEKGAFTGATGMKIGLVAAAEGGTLFLDEVGEMPAAMQIGLLRFLDHGEYRPVGSIRTLKTDVRIICATNRDIQNLVTQGQFREDLFYRLNSVTLCVPPLRERLDDIPVLVEHMLHSITQPAISRRALSREAISTLRAYSWPGNVRELRNVIERLVMMGGSKKTLTGGEVAGVLPTRLGDAHEGDLSRASLEEVERQHILRVLDACEGNKTRAATILQIDYKTLLAKLKK